jgi:site-specific recombinase XerD
MLEALVHRKHDRVRLQSGPMAPHLETFADTLADEGYAARVVRRYVFATDAFGRWLDRQGVELHDVDAATVARYIEGLGRVRCGARQCGRQPDAGSGIRKLLTILRRGGVVRSPALAHLPGDTDCCLTAFEHHLDRVAGLSLGTRGIYLRYARALVTMRFGTAPPDWSTLSADDVAAFVCRQAQSLKPSARRAPGTATRALLRFLETTGAVRPGLAGAVPIVRQWKHAALPQHLSTEEIDRVLAAGGEAAPQGRRDRAIVTLLVRLGLRAGEVASLGLDDIDWSQGCVRIRGTKSGRDRSLPLANDVGQAVVAYLRHARPSGSSRNVFFRARPPYGPLRSRGVSAIIQRLGFRAGIDALRRGAHALRHTAATLMVRRGASFKQVADILGHARLETTAIYAKLDLETLAQVALPWPGRVR